jgi:hypothetical protein
MTSSLVPKASSILVFLFCPFFIFAQEVPEVPGYLERRFIFEAGGGIEMPGNFSVPALHLHPRLNIINSFSDVSASIAVPVKAGGTPLVFSAALISELNFGHAATKDFYKKKGLSAGAGYGLALIDDKVSLGPVFSAAVRSWLFKQSVSIHYMLQVLKSDKVHGVSLTFTVGPWLKKNRRLNKVSNFVKPYRK